MLHLHALLLAVASSTDNFAVGFSEGIKRQPNPNTLNLFIAACNASGALAATSMGEAMSGAGTFAPFLASIAFAYLGWNDLRASDSPQGQNQQQHTATFSLALPMTLNNLAGGVAGGATGMISGWMAFFYAFLASFVAMASGYQIGWRVSKRRKMDSSKIAAAIFFCLCLITLYEALRSISR